MLRCLRTQTHSMLWCSAAAASTGVAEPKFRILAAKGLAEQALSARTLLVRM